MKYRKKPVVIDAIQYQGWNSAACLAFCPTATFTSNHRFSLSIPTLEGDMRVSVRDWIIKGVAGEFYPCKDEIFKATYDEVYDPARAVG